MHTSEQRELLRRMTFTPHKNAEQRRQSLLAAAKAIVSADGIIREHRAVLLRTLLFRYTEASTTSKHRLKFHSIESLTAPKKLLRHEHVYRRKFLVRAILDEPSSVAAVFDRSVACVVTKDEHDQLNVVEKDDPKVDGWERYRRANIVVRDCETAAILDLDSLVSPHEDGRN